MNRLLLLAALTVVAGVACAVSTKLAGNVSVDDAGRIIVNGEKLFIVRQHDGKHVPLREVQLIASVGANPGLILSMYWDVPAPSAGSGTERFVVVDASTSEVRRSNVVDTGQEFEWGDNNYVLFEKGVMYFGIYTPKRMQFVYRDGKLEVDTGPWRGPAKPEVYIEPTGNDPCFNVNGVEDCRAEVERNQAAERAKRRHKLAPPAAKASSAASAVH